MTSYDSVFFTEETRVALSAAQIVLPGVLADTGAQSVVDVGCGTGAWLSVAAAHGRTVLGIDGYAPDDKLLIRPGDFIRRELTLGFDCAGYDLAICLEVGEHLPEWSAPALVAGLCQARFVLFSAAHPGQGGVNHINENSSEHFWAPLFAEHGYVGSSDLRWRHWDEPCERVQTFYKENLLGFARPDDLATAGWKPGVVDIIHPERLSP